MTKSLVCNTSEPKFKHKTVYVFSNHNIIRHFSDIAKITHVNLFLEVNFEKEVLEGFAVLTIEKVDPNATEIILDVRELNIIQITDQSNGTKLDFVLHPSDYIGSQLQVNLPNSSERFVKVRIDYETTSKCTALQWLSPEQTAGKTHPFVFSQCQANHCRSMMPCQDTSSVKMTYSAEVSKIFKKLFYQNSN